MEEEDLRRKKLGNVFLRYSIFVVQFANCRVASSATGAGVGKVNYRGEGL